MTQTAFYGFTRELLAARVCVALTALGVAIVGLPAASLTINITDPDPTYSASQTPCPNHPGPGSTCGVEAHLFTDPISFSANYFFDEAWNAWNATNAANQQWTKVDGGVLNATVNVSEFDAVSSHTNHGVGGVEITIQLDYNGADRDDFVWTQGLYDNYLLDGSIVAPFYEMDVDNNCVTSGNWCPPVYPFQYNDEHFYDGPRAPFDTGFFEADAFLTKVNYTTRTLTVYEGVHYGFYLYAVPEPTTGALMALGLIAIAVRRRKATH